LSPQVHLRSPFILNGVCVRWRGWLDLERLDGVGCLEFDEESALLEDAKLREQVHSMAASRTLQPVRAAIARRNSMYVH
jgi:hypothetical protein